MRTTRAAVAAVATVAALAVAGCSDDDPETAPTTETTASPAASFAVDDAIEGMPDDPMCQSFGTMLQVLVDANESSDPEDMPGFLEELQTDYAAVTESAPEEISEALTTVNDQMQEYDSMFAFISDTDAEVLAARNEIDAWLVENCDIDAASLTEAFAD